MAIQEMRGSAIQIWRCLDLSIMICRKLYQIGRYMAHRANFGSDIVLLSCLIEITSRQSVLMLEIMHTVDAHGHTRKRIHSVLKGAVR